MKKFLLLPILSLLSVFQLSFSNTRGGDVLQVFLNGRQVHQQFVHVDKSAKTLHLTSVKESDRLEVFYSHCGHTGKSRVLIFKNEMGEVVKKLTYPDVEGNVSRMAFSKTDVLKANGGNLKLFYASKEMTEARWVATISWENSKNKTASL